MAKTIPNDPDVPKPVRGNVPNRVEQPSPAFVSFYANDAQVMMTPWDFRLRLGQLESVEDGEAVVTVLADVRFSPAHLKRLVEVLGKQLESYEANVGPIAVPD